MGCGASKKDAPPPDQADKPKLTSEEQRRLMLQSDFRRSTTGLTELGVLEMYKQVKASPDDTKLDKQKMRQLFIQVNDTTFEYMFNLLDEGQGHCGQTEFLMTMVLLNNGDNLTLNDQIRLAFNMFDVERTGELSKAEFRAMIHATMNLGLEFMLTSSTGLEFFKKQLQQEYSEENILFWQEVHQFEMKEGEVDQAEAKRIYDTFVHNNADHMINLPNELRSTLNEAFAPERLAEHPVPRTIFHPAKKEIYQLMERDSYQRFKTNHDDVNTMVDAFFKEADKQGNDKISYEEYSAWAHANPAALGCVGNVAAVSKQVTKNSRRHQLSQRFSLTSFALARRTSQVSSPTSRKKNSVTEIKQTPK